MKLFRLLLAKYTLSNPPQLFEYNSEYMSPAMSPSRSYNGSRQNSPGPSGVNPLLHANSAVSSPHPTPRFNVQVEQVIPLCHVARCAELSISIVKVVKTCSATLL